MEEWKSYRIGDLCKIKHGFAFKGIYFVNTPQRYICVTPGNFSIKGGFKNDKPKYYKGPIPENFILKEDDLIVTMTDLSKDGDTLGYSALVPNDSGHVYLHNQRIGLVIDISPLVDKHFLYWLMRTNEYQRFIVGHCSGSTVKHTSPTNICNYSFKLPSITTQKSIANILDTIDSKIELNNRINPNLEEQAQALYKSWFIDFEPFKNGKFVDSELGTIPEGWRVGTLSELGDIVAGGTPSKARADYYTDNGIHWLTPKDLSNRCDKYTSRGETDITELGYNNSSAKLMPRGSVLFSSRAPIGYITIAKNDICTNQGFKSVIPKYAGTYYIYYWLSDNTDNI